MREADKKKAKLTPEHVEESRRLRRIYDDCKARLGRDMLSQAEIGSEFKIGNQSMVGHLLAGRSALTLESAVAFAKALSCKVEDFSPRLAEKQKELASSPRNDAGYSGSAREVAQAIALSIQGIADKWGIQDARDLLDPSPEARSRVEHAIATAGFKAVAAKPVLKHMDDDRPGSTRAGSGSN
jgi:hypothetical protein